MDAGADAGVGGAAAQVARHRFVDLRVCRLGVLLEQQPGEEMQVNYGEGAPTRVKGTQGLRLCRALAPGDVAAV